MIIPMITSAEALPVVWFVLIAVLWTGYLVLDGFDFGVGMLLRPVGRDDQGRRIVLHAIGPVWDGNEVWLIVAGGATFAAFPEWYASLFSGAYLALLVILVALIVRVCALEYRGKHDDPGWIRRWDWAITISSLVPPLVWGVALADFVHGLPMDSAHNVIGGLPVLFSPYSVLGGVALVLLCLTHGAAFLALRTSDEVRERARRIGLAIGLPAAAALGGFVFWTALHGGHARVVALVIAAVATLGVLGGWVATRTHHDGWAFVGTAIGVAGFVACVFSSIFPAVLPSTLDPAGTLTISNAAATPHTLTIMTVVAAIMTPIILLYQGWTYWVFRRRLSTRQLAASAHEPGPARS